MIDLVNLRDGGLIQQAGGPPAGRDLVDLLQGEICWSKEKVINESH